MCKEEIHLNNSNGNLENDKEYQEWKACNEHITRLDSIIIDLRKYGFSIATGLTTAGSIITQFTEVQPFQIVLIFATMALIDVLYWLDVYYQTVLSAVILRTQVLEQRLNFGLDIYISRFYMRHKIGKALHLLYIGFLIYLAILAAQIIAADDSVLSTGITVVGWIIFLVLPIFFIFGIWYFFDRRRYKTYLGAQRIVANFLRTGYDRTPDTNRTIDQEITDYLDSDKEDLGLDLGHKEWIYYDVTEKKWWLPLWSRKLIVTNNQIYALKLGPVVSRWIASIDYYNSSVVDEKSDTEPRSFAITEVGLSTPEPNFKIKIQKREYDKILKYVKGMSQANRLDNASNRFRLEQIG
jgi:hypothetical protein